MPALIFVQFPKFILKKAPLTITLLILSVSRKQICTFHFILQEVSRVTATRTEATTGTLTITITEISTETTTGKLITLVEQTREQTQETIIETITAGESQPEEATLDVDESLYLLCMSAAVGLVKGIIFGVQSAAHSMSRN